jgi:hypothetical protein
MSDTYCPTCGEPWDMGERQAVGMIHRYHRCPCCKPEMETDSTLDKKMMKLLFDEDCDDGDPFSFI